MMGFSAFFIYFLFIFLGVLFYSYYQGVEFIREVEDACRQEMATYFGCSEVELRPISGQMSNEIVFKAMCKRQVVESRRSN